MKTIYNAIFALVRWTVGVLVMLIAALPALTSVSNSV